MPSPIRRKVEPLFGWLFLAGIAVALAITFLAATRPILDGPGRFPADQSR
jgi:hypothetical protein